MGGGEVHDDAPGAVFLRHYPERGALEVWDRWCLKRPGRMTIGYLLRQGS